LSADVYAIRGETVWWIFDVGASDEAADFINNLPCDGVAPGTAQHLHQDAAPLKKNIVISHFHRDHFFNLSRVSFDNLFVGRETFRHCDANIQARHGVNVVEAPIVIEDGLQFRVEPIPSSHAKGSLVLFVGECCACDDRRDDVSAFLGDSTYPTVGHGRPDSYNVQLLFQQIQFLRSCTATQFYMSHRRFIPREKESVLQVLEGYYAQREPNKNLIEISR